jgi:hypothetical protein
MEAGGFDPQSSTTIIIYGARPTDETRPGTSHKLQASSTKLIKVQAASIKPQAASVKLQATSVKLPDP